MIHAQGLIIVALRHSADPHAVPAAPTHAFTSELASLPDMIGGARRPHQ
jgi:hypothetical protein